MSRNLTAAAITETTAQNLRPILLVQGYFVSGWLYLWSGYGSIVWNSQTWTGAGELLSVSPLTENSDVMAEGVQISLSGIPADLISKALSEVRQGAPMIIWQGFLTAAGAVVSSPNQAFAGRMDTCSIAEGAETARITLTVESRLADLKRSRERRYTHDDQQIDFPGDLGFEFVAKLQELSLVWGGQNVPVSAPSGGQSQSGRDYGAGGHEDRNGDWVWDGDEREGW